MALQDLTPQLRTRLDRLERTVGIFVLIASLLLLAGLAFYLRQTAERRGWFLRKLPYFTFVRTAGGLKVGDPVKLMGLDVGEITDIQPQPPGDYYDMFVSFWVKEPYDGYIWDDSRAKISVVDFLGKRCIEITKGTNGSPSYLFFEFKEVPVTEVESFLGNGRPMQFVDEIYDETATNLLARPKHPVTSEVLQRIISAGSVATLRLIDSTNETKMPTGVWSDREARYKDPKDPQTRKGYFLTPDESPALTERLEAVVQVVNNALPGILNLTNRVQTLLDNAATAAAHADRILGNAEPVVTNLNLLTENFASISRHLSNPRGSLGDWLFPTNLSSQLTQTLASANAILTNSDARVTELALDLDQALENLAKITGNLHDQVRGNTNLVRQISRLIVDADDLVQGLKRHWLLRSAFRGASNPPPPSSKSRRATSPKDDRSPQ
jgi:ABC-type transporter Mla subunit MlaD